MPSKMPNKWEPITMGTKQSRARKSEAKDGVSGPCWLTPPAGTLQLEQPGMRASVFSPVAPARMLGSPTAYCAPCLHDTSFRTVDLSEAHPTESKEKPFTQSCRQQGDQPPPLVLDRDPRTGRGLGHHPSRGGLALERPWLEAVGMEKGYMDAEHPRYLARGMYLAFSDES